MGLGFLLLNFVKDTSALLEHQAPNPPPTPTPTPTSPPRCRTGRTALWRPPISPLCLPYISLISRLYLPYAGLGVRPYGDRQQRAGLRILARTLASTPTLTLALALDIPPPQGPSHTPTLTGHKDPRARGVRRLHPAERVHGRGHGHRCQAAPHANPNPSTLTLTRTP